MKILIAEDDPVSCLVLERTLQRWGYEVIKTQNGEEAWARYQEEPTGIVITDWMMPVTDGVELCRRIRTLSSEQYTYVILLTAKSQKIDMVNGLNAGADDFITKPFDSAELYARIRAGERVLDLETSLMQGQKEIKAINAQLEKSVLRQNHVNQVLRALTSSLDFDLVMKESVEPLRQLFQCSRSFVRIVNREEKVLQVVAESCAPNVAPMGAIDFPLERDGDHEDYVYNSQRNASDLNADLDTDKRVMTRIFTNAFGVKATLCEPLVYQGKWFGDIGLQQCDQPRKWTEDELHLLVTLAQQVSVVAANADLHQKVQEQSVRDALTGLFNRRHFDYALETELQRANRYDQELSLVMVDLDFLKKINDELGHLAGDVAIQHTGNILQNQSRRVDIATRYGGEEFAVILPQTSLEGAMSAAEHWRQAISKFSVGEMTLSASFGVATFPHHATNALQLIQCADAALYQAKHEGRNCVRPAGAMESSAQAGDRFAR